MFQVEFDPVLIRLSATSFWSLTIFNSNMGSGILYEDISRGSRVCRDWSNRYRLFLAWKEPKEAIKESDGNLKIYDIVELVEKAIYEKEG